MTSRQLDALIVILAIPGSLIAAYASTQPGGVAIVATGAGLIATALILLHRPHLWAVAFFLGCWFVGLEQYIFLPTLAGFVLLFQREPGRRVGGVVVVATALVAILGIFAYIRLGSDPGALRTTVVWGGAALLVVAWQTSTSGRSLIMTSLLGAWLLSIIAAAIGFLAPGLARWASDGRTILTSLATNPGFLSPTEYLGREWGRPVGLMLYANEMALFGLLVAALAAIHWRGQRPRLVAALIAVSVVGVIASSSRTLTVLVAAAIAGWLLSRVFAKAVPGAARLALIGAAGVAGVLLLSLIDPLNHWQEAVVDQFAGARSGNSNSDRALSYAIGWELYERNRWSGVGTLPSIGPIQAGSHSLPLSMLVRFGIPGMVLLLVLLIPVFWASVHEYIQAGRARAWTGLVGIVACVGCISIQFDGDAYAFAAFGVFGAALLSSQRSEAHLRSSPPDDLKLPEKSHR